MSMKVLTATVGLSLGLLGAAVTAQAHPHVFVTAKTEIVFDTGKVAAIANHWTFDEFYTAMAVEGLDTNKDGIYSREELAELTKVNLSGLKEFDYFTFAKSGEAKIAFAEPVDAWMEHKDGLLSLHFKLPLATPAAPGPKGFMFSNTDPSSFIAFDLAKGDAITLAGAPPTCSVTVGEMDESADNKTLAGAFSQQLNQGSGGPKSALVTCKP